MKRPILLLVSLLLCVLVSCSDPVLPARAPHPPPIPANAPLEVSLAEVVPAYVRFGKFTAHSAGATREITVRNAGSTDISLQGATVDPPFAIGSTSATLRPSEQTVLVVSFTPGAAGDYTADLVLTFDSIPPKSVVLWAAVVDAIQSIPISGPGVLDVAGANYVLQNDITTDGTCFSVQAPYITLDLNGYTIVYGSTPATSPRHGVVTAAAWAPGIGDNPAGGVDRGLEIRNGTIRQGAGGGDRCHAVAFYQMNGGGHYEIAHLNIEVWGPSSVNIWASYRGQFDIHDNLLTSNVTVIGNRHAIDGTLIKIGARPPKFPGIIHDNVLVGGAQGGIFVTGNGGQVYRNDVSQASSYSNDFGIYAWADGLEVFENYIHPTSGRGIQVWNTPNVKIWQNRVDVISLPNNEEYGGCELGGAYGIQLDEERDGSTANCLVFRNEVLARADACPGRAFRATSIGPSRNLVCENLFVAQRTGSALAEAVSINGVTGLELVGNLLKGDTANLGIDTGGANGILYRDNVFEGLTPMPDYTTSRFRNRTPTRVELQDSEFRNGASPTSVSMLPIGSLGGYVGPSELLVSWTLSLRILSGTNSPISGARIVIHDATGNVAAQGVSDGAGYFVNVLQQYEFHNTTTSELEQMVLTPHTISVNYDNRSMTRQILMDLPQELDLQL